MECRDEQKHLKGNREDEDSDEDKGKNKDNDKDTLNRILSPEDKKERLRQLINQKNSDMDVLLDLDVDFSDFEDDEDATTPSTTQTPSKTPIEQNNSSATQQLHTAPLSDEEIEEGELREDVALDTPIRIDTKRYGSSLLESDSSDDEPSHKRRSSRFGSERRSPDSSHKKTPQSHTSKRTKYNQLPPSQHNIKPWSQAPARNFVVSPPPFPPVMPHGHLGNCHDNNGANSSLGVMPMPPYPQQAGMLPSPHWSPIYQHEMRFMPPHQLQLALQLPRNQHRDDARDKQRRTEGHHISKASTKHESSTNATEANTTKSDSSATSSCSQSTVSGSRQSSGKVSDTSSTPKSSSIISIKETKRKRESSKTILITNLSKSTNTPKLVAEFSSVGEIEGVQMVPEGATISFREASSAVAAKRKYNRSMFDGSRIIVEVQK